MLFRSSLREWNQPHKTSSPAPHTPRQVAGEIPPRWLFHNDTSPPCQRTVEIVQRHNFPKAKNHLLKEPADALLNLPASKPSVRAARRFFARRFRARCIPLVEVAIYYGGSGFVNPFASPNPQVKRFCKLLPSDGTACPQALPCDRISAIKLGR